MNKKNARKNSRLTREFGTVAHPGDSVVGVRSCRDSTSRLLLAGSCSGSTVTVYFPSQAIQSTTTITAYFPSHQSTTAITVYFHSQASLQRQSQYISPHKPVYNDNHSIFPSQASLQRQSQYISPHKPVYKGSHSIFPLTSQSTTAITVYFHSQVSLQLSLN